MIVPNKPYVLIYPGDFSGCSHVRLRERAYHFWEKYAESGEYNPLIMSNYVFDPMILSLTKCIVFQRPAGGAMVEIVNRYKGLQAKFGYKMVAEFDDMIWRDKAHEDDGVPDYNPSNLHPEANDPNKIREINETLEINLKNMDRVIVSTDFLKLAMEKKYHLDNVTVVRNTIPRYLWNYPRREELKEDIKKPKIIYTGSPTHYTNPIPPRPPSPQEPKGFPGVPGKAGDFDSGLNHAWINYIIEAVNNDEIEFVCMGTLPFFFQSIAPKIKVLNWVTCLQYPGLVLRENADISIAPLVRNDFNKCKSDLRYIETCASQSVFLGTIFRKDEENGGIQWSPYAHAPKECLVYDDCTVEDIRERVKWLCKKENFNRIKKQHYEDLNNNNWFMESNGAINNFTSVIEGGANQQVI